MALELLVRQDPLNGVRVGIRREGAEDHDHDPEQDEAGDDDDQKDTAHFAGHGPDAVPASAWPPRCRVCYLPAR